MHTRVVVDADLDEVRSMLTDEGYIPG